MNILILLPEHDVCWQFLPKENIERLNALGTVHYNKKGRQFKKDELRELLPQMDAVISGWGSPLIGKEVLSDKHPAILAHVGGSVAPYTDEGTFEKGVRVVSANRVYAKSVAEGTLAYILCALRNIPYWDREVRAGRWRSEDAQSFGLFGKKIGLTAYGTIPSFLVPLLRAFDAEILVRSGHMSDADCAALGVKKAELDEIFATCDIISVHNALTEKTRGLIDGRLLGMIRDDAVLVNTARGAVINEAAMIKELQKNRFTACLDVFEQEPLPLDSALFKMDNVILVPHMASPTSDLHPASGRAVIEDIGRLMRGEPLEYEIKGDFAKNMTN